MAQDVFILACRWPPNRAALYINAAFNFMVAAQSGNRALGSSSSGIASDLNWIQCLRSAAVGKAVRLLIINWQDDIAWCLIIPRGNGVYGASAVVEIPSSKRQRTN